MDAINFIYERFGGENLARIFRTYWLLLLVIKQLMFSLFSAEPLELPVHLHSKEVINKEITTTETGKESFSGFDFMRVLITTAQLEPHMLLEKPKQILKPNPPTHTNETF